MQLSGEFDPVAVGTIMPKRKLEKVKQVKEQAQLRVGRPPWAQVIPNKKRDAQIKDERED
jgi:hypothetical protein